MCGKFAVGRRTKSTVESSSARECGNFFDAEVAVADLCLLQCVRSECDSMTVVDVLTKHFWFQRDEFTHAEHVMCKSCWNRLDDFHRFYQEVEENHRTLNVKPSEASNLLDGFNGIVQIHSEIEIKKEGICIDSETVVEKEDILIHSGTGIEKEAARRQFESDIEEGDLRLHSEIEIKEEDSSHQSEDVESDYENSTISSSNETQNQDPKEPGSIKRKVKSKQKTWMDKDADDIIQTHVSYICTICGEHFTKFHELKTHIEGVHRKGAFVVCCGNRYSRRLTLLEHVLKLKNPNLFKCEICGKNLANSKSVRRHMAEVHVPKEERMHHQCDQCPKRFARARVLKYHMKQHTDDKSYKEAITCPRCQKRFQTIDSRNKHIKSQHDREHYDCTLCKQTFVSKYYLQRHMTVHKPTRKDRGAKSNTDVKS